MLSYMISYHLAEELKNADFPQHGSVGSQYYRFIAHPRLGIPPQHSITTQTTANASFNKTGEYTLIPTLSKLIAECVAYSETGDFHLEHNSIDKQHPDGWEASVDCFKSEPYMHGKTPEEACARLWLSLQKRPLATRSAQE